MNVDSSSGSARATRLEVRRYVILAFSITWGVGGLAVIIGRLSPSPGLTSSHPLYFLAAYGPSVAALIMTARLEGRPGLRALLSRIVPRPAMVPWYLAVLVGFPTLMIGAAANYCGAIGVPFPVEAGAEAVVAVLIVAAGGLRPRDST